MRCVRDTAATADYRREDGGEGRRTARREARGAADADQGRGGHAGRRAA